MAREEIIKKVKTKMCKDCGVYLGGGKCSDNCSITKIIRVLEQEPCEDTISRQAVLEIQTKYAEHIGATKFWQMRDDIRALPPVTPQPKVGRWIRWCEQREYDCGTQYIPHCKCSECGREYDSHLSQFIKYCNECGAKMQEVEE